MRLCAIECSARLGARRVVFLRSAPLWQKEACVLPTWEGGGAARAGRAFVLGMQADVDAEAVGLSCTRFWHRGSPDTLLLAVRSLSRSVSVSVSLALSLFLLLSCIFPSLSPSCVACASHRVTTLDEGGGSGERWGRSSQQQKVPSPCRTSGELVARRASDGPL